MKKSINRALCVTTSFYFAVACLGYAAFGDVAPTNLLIVQHVGSSRTGFTNPYWLVDCANVFVMVNMLGCYQVISGVHALSPCQHTGPALYHTAASDVVTG